ncbi:MAG: hypothetical protein WBA74_15050 [Cyclobacteriaceae bacterium]
MQYQEIESQQALEELLKSKNQFDHIAFQAVDFVPFTEIIEDMHFHQCLFMGCKLSKEMTAIFTDDNIILPVFQSPFLLYPNKLYNKTTIFSDYQLGDPSSYKQTYDKKVYDHFTETNFLKESIRESLARTLHDHSIADAMDDFLVNFDEKRVVGIMGGHSLPRTDPKFKSVAKIARRLTQKGYLMISGGGPGGMEATHLGVWFADKEESALDEAIILLEKAPSYKDESWLDTAMQVLAKYPDTKYQSLGIPTWLYGHEPPTPFATHIAKFFDNSIREDAILTIAKGGLIFAPGSAGTIQEIFQDATQNHYLTQQFSSPMIFFGEEYWTKGRPVYPLLQQMSDEGKYENLKLTITDQQEGIISALADFYNPEEKF